MFNVSKLVFVGVVACASMLGACMAEEPGDIAADSEALVKEGAATDDVTIYTEEDAKSGKVSPADVSIQATVSFIRTCSGWSFLVRNSDGAVVFADASSCRRRNGTWTGYRSWSGVCHGDVSNQDGTIRC